MQTFDKAFGMNRQLHDFLIAVDEGARVVNDYAMPGIITQCDEWMTEGWEVRNDTLTGPMYAAALFNEANTQDECVKDGTSDAEYPKSLRMLALKILEVSGHGTFTQGSGVWPTKFELK